MTPNNPSKPVPLETEAVEAAAKAIVVADETRDPSGSALRYRNMARAAILAADEAREMRVEKGIESQSFPGEWLLTGEGGTPTRYRLVSDWKPIKGPVDE